MENIDWITIVILVSLVSLTLAKVFFQYRFLNFIILPFNNKYIFMYNKKEKLVNWFQIFTTLFQVLNTALFLFYIWKIFRDPTDMSYLFVFLTILVGTLTYGSGKLFLQIGNAFIFGSVGPMSEIIFKKISYFNYGALVLFTANVFLTYVFHDSKTLIYCALALVVLINGIGWITVLKNHQKLITTYFFYFILYLCALEIAPLIIIGSYLTA